MIAMFCPQAAIRSVTSDRVSFLLTELVDHRVDFLLVTYGANGVA